MSTLKELYKSEVIPALIKQYGYTTVMAVPKLEKIVINVGCGDAITNNKAIEESYDEIKTLSGQAPVITKASKSIANFKLRQGMNIGLKVTLRGEKMYHFLQKLIVVVLPRVRDFRGLNGNGCDGRGNYNFGLKEQLVFPEVNFDKVKKVRGMNITIVTTAADDLQCKALLSAFGLPFRK